MKTIQEYIDETPRWADNTEILEPPLTGMQWLIWVLAAAGKFFEGMVVFMTGVALPLMDREFGLTATEKGMAASASLFGILIGATALGGLSDRYGRKKMFVTEMVIFILFICILALSHSFPLVVVALVGIGIALGCDYPTAHLVISETIPSRVRGRMVLGAFAFQAVGALVGTGVGFIVLYENPELGDWRWMYASTLLLAVPVTVGRFFIVNSPHWLASRGHFEGAEKALRRLLNRTPAYPKVITIHRGDDEHIHHKKVAWKELFHGKNLKRTLLASVPWFLQDLGTYGIGIFTPTILVTLIGIEIHNPRNLAELIVNDELAARGAAIIDVLLIAGMLAAICLADWVGRIRLQIAGFFGCAAGLLLAAVSLGQSGPVALTLVFAGFMLFNFMTNMGPNAMTYLIAGEVFPTRVRGLGAGFAASVAKVGAVVTAFFFPVMLKDFGTTVILAGLIVTSLLGALITKIYAIETKGLNLEKVG